MDVKPIAGVQSSLETNLQSMELKKHQALSNQPSELRAQEKNESNRVSPEVLEEVIKNLKEKLSMLNTQLQIQIDKDTDIVVVKVIDKKTKEVIRQIPPEYVLKIAKYLDEIAGLLFSEKV
jgi:flagellar protein FlaG